MRTVILGLISGLLLVRAGLAADDQATKEPKVEVYSRVDGRELKAYVFEPAGRKQGERVAAVVVIHGGGWARGNGSWSFGAARRFAELGMVGVGIEYRLSDQKMITPLEAMADARAAIRWTRSKSESFGIDPERIAAYGWSAGGHLAAAAAMIDEPGAKGEVNSAPNALVLVCPAVDLENDNWVKRLLGWRTNAAAISPATNVRKGLPPTLVLQARSDTVTPLAEAELFCERMKAAGNRCELEIYEGVGHMFTPVGKPDDGWPQPDPEVEAKAAKIGDAFLKELGYWK